MPLYITLIKQKKTSWYIKQNGHTPCRLTWDSPCILSHFTMTPGGWREAWGYARGTFTPTRMWQWVGSCTPSEGSITEKRSSWRKYPIRKSLGFQWKLRYLTGTLCSMAVLQISPHRLPAQNIFLSSHVPTHARKTGCPQIIFSHHRQLASYKFVLCSLAAAFCRVGWRDF